MTRSTDQRWRFLGDTSIPWQNGERTPHLSKKAIGLLAYLALAREGAGRDEIATLLWPSPDPTRSKHNLRQCLLSLRKVFGDTFSELLRVTDHRLALNHSAVDIDARMLLEIDDGTRSADELLSICSGPFLQGLTTRAGPFDEWVVAQRNRLSRAAERALTASRAEAESAGRKSEAARLAAALAHLSVGSPDEPANLNTFSAHFLPRRQRWMRTAALIFGSALISAGLLFSAYNVSLDFRDWVDQIVLGIPDSPPRITVVQFTSVNNSAEEKGLAGGVTLGVYFGLYAITAKELFVVTTPISMPRDSSQEDLKRIARNLKVRYLITGSVAVEGDTVRVDAQRLDVESGTGDVIRRNEFNKPTGIAFKLQDDITRWIIEGLDIELSTAEWERIKYLDGTDKLDAWLAAANGVSHLIRINQKDAEIAWASYQKALDIDPDYIDARRGLAWVDYLGVKLGWADDRIGALRRAKENLAIVLAGAPDAGTSQNILGAILLVEGKYDEAIEASRLAKKLLPGSADVTAVLAYNMTYVGEHNVTLELIDEAMDLSPMHPGFYRWAKGRALRLAGRIPESIEILEKDLDRGKPAIAHLVELAASYSAAGRMTAARATAARIREIDPDFSAEVWLGNPPISVPEIQLRELKYLADAGL